ncbi:MAG: tellurium resistance protein [Rhodobacteraceae bacterium]|nr:tellurium resistance protein [Paracoccaceae bacterium]
MARPSAIRGGIGRRTPPAVFTVIMGLLNLGIGWRVGAERFGLPGEPAEMLLGAGVLVYLFAAAVYALKVVRRPGVAGEDLRTLPGRAGLSAMIMSVYLLAIVFVPYQTGLANGLLAAGLGLHLVLVGALVNLFTHGPREQAMVNPVWNLSFVAVLIGGIAAHQLGHDGLAQLIFGLGLLAAVPIWVVSTRQLLAKRPPPPLRPLLVIHLAPTALLGNVAHYLGYGVAAQGFAIASAGLVLLMLWHVRWLTAAGFSPFWGAFTFPVAAVGVFWLRLGGPWAPAGAAVILGASVLIPWIAVRIVRLWMSGRLSAMTNAAVA